MNTLCIEDNEQQFYLIHSPPATGGGSGEIAEVEAAAAAMRGPRKDAT